MRLIPGELKKQYVLDGLRVKVTPLGDEDMSFTGIVKFTEGFLLTSRIDEIRMNSINTVVTKMDGSGSCATSVKNVEVIDDIVLCWRVFSFHRKIDK